MNDLARAAMIGSVWPRGAPRVVLADRRPTARSARRVLRRSAESLLNHNNSGSCPLTIDAIASSSPEFVPAEVLSYPLVIAPAGSCRFRSDSSRANSERRARR